MKMSLRYHVLVILCLFGMAALMMIAAVNFADLAKAGGANTWDTASLRSVVRITAGQGRGSGVIIGAKKVTGGYRVSIITNEHVVKNLCNEVGSPEWRHEECTLPRIESALEDGSGKLVRSNALSDLALITITFKVKPSISQISVQPLYAFERVLAIGCGLGVQPFPTEGMISLPRITSPLGLVYILHSAPIINGNSGGGLFAYNAKLRRNELIGINDAIMNGGGSVGVPHMALAIPASTVLAFLAAGA